MHGTEINGKICKTVNKVTAVSLNEESADFRYQRQLTDYGFKLMSSQIEKHDDIEIIETGTAFLVPATDGNILLRTAHVPVISFTSTVYPASTYLRYGRRKR